MRRRRPMSHAAIGWERGAALGVSCLLLLLTSCSSSSTKPDRTVITSTERFPAWVENHPLDPEYPRDRYLTGIGVADAQGENNARVLAEEQARAEISRIIRTELRSALETYMEAIARNDTYLNKEVVREKIESSTEGELRGAEVVRSWRDPQSNRVWVKVALSKRKYADYLVSEVRSGLAQIRATRETAAASASAGTRLPALLVAYQQTTVQLGQLAQLSAVVDREGPKIMSARTELLQLATKTLADISEIGGTLELSVVSGDAQLGMPGGTLPDPIIVVARAGSDPLAGFPIQFAFAGVEGHEGLDSASLTGTDGTAACRVLRIPTGGLVHPRVEVRLDYSSFAPDFPDQLIPRAAAQFQLPTLDGTRIAVVVDERNGRQSDRAGVVRGRLAEMLTRKGARLVPVTPSNAAASPANGASAAWLQKLASDDVEYVVWGQVRAVPRPKQTFYFSYAGGTVELIEVSSGAVLASVHVEPNGSIKGADVNTQSQAGVAALTTLGNHLARELRQELRLLFAD